MKVIITENVSVPFKVANGSEGVVIKDIVYEEDEQGNRVAKLTYVEIPKSLIHVPDLPKRLVPIFASQTSIKLPYPIKNFDSKSFRHLQLPLMPAYSYTDYKS
jgi:ATP-dependent DNA helicase PIF1